MRSTIFDSSEKENAAAAEMLITPEMVVASRMESSVGLILGPGCDAARLQIIDHRAQRFQQTTWETPLSSDGEPGAADIHASSKRNIPA
ncbi:hypothetical protein [Noviherbaspirillum massiliense]|uniref:hypothetical protein n=1 Tax=Noviherbaspirillum massiliense TaxID=1465823 RepID=UPI0011DE2C4F|nr:hypothetical protein [Noviherbaspirillum massiliense]